MAEGGGSAPGGEGGDDPMMTENGFDGSPRVKGAGTAAKVDAAVLQYQNQKLVQKLEAQKSEMHALEGKFKELKEKQISYDKTLITVNRIWNQLVDDLVLLGIRAGGNSDGLLTLDHKDSSTETVAAFPPEEIFVHRLLKTHSTENNKGNGTIKYVQDSLALRHSSTMNLMEHLLETINVPRTKTESLQLALRGNISLEDAIMQLQKLNDSLKEQANNMRQAIEVIHQKHKQYADEINSYFDSHKRDQSEIKRLSGELEESMAELEESRRKLVILQMQKHGTSVMNTLVANAVNGSNSLDKPEDRTVSLRELKISVEEAKALAASRLAELQEAQEDKSILSKQLEELQNKLVDEKYIFSSKPYSLLSQQLQDLNLEIGRYKGFIESLQADRNNLLRREKELSAKVESAEAANGSIINHDGKIKELELQVQKLITERNDLEMKFEEADQDLGRRDIKDEFRVMSSALSKEMEMMETQLNRSKEAAYEALSLREEANSLRGILNKKISEQKTLSDRCAEQLVEIKSLKALIKELEKGKQELESFLDMYGQESCDNRTIAEIKESEHRALTQAEILRNALDEHSLELRVKAANEAEAACQQRLSIAEAEIEELRVKLDASEREILELTESVRIKDAEAETYISEIETIGQAYEDMQTQNQHLLQQVANRDNYNIKLVSNSMKMKQIHSSLLSDKQALIKQLQQLNETLEPFKMTIARIDEQVNTFLVRATTASSNNRSLSIHLESATLDLTNAEKEVKWLRSAIDSSEEEYKQNQKKVHELGVDVGRERNERKKLEEELQELKGEIVEMSPENEEAAIQKLQDEIKEFKAILKCGVCFDRPKEVLITKCFHLFCSPCIQRNLEIRHRKCPGCGTPFGQSDVREVNI